MMTIALSARNVFSSHLDIQNFSVNGDMFTMTQKSTGKVLAPEAPDQTTFMSLPQGYSMNPVARHKMPAVFDAMRYEGQYREK